MKQLYAIQLEFTYGWDFPAGGDTQETFTSKAAAAQALAEHLADLEESEIDFDPAAYRIVALEIVPPEGRDTEITLDAAKEWIAKLERERAASRE